MYCRFIHSTNRQGRSFKVAVNHLADTNQDERRRMRGYRYTGPNNGLPFTLTEEMVQALPASLDWRLIGRHFFVCVILMLPDVMTGRCCNTCEGSRHLW